MVLSKVRDFLILFSLVLTMSCSIGDSSQGPPDEDKLTFCNTCCSFDSTVVGMTNRSSSCVVGSAADTPETACETIAGGLGGINITMHDPNDGYEDLRNVAGCLVSQRFDEKNVFNLNTTDELASIVEKNKQFSELSTQDNAYDNLANCKKGCTDDVACVATNNNTPNWKESVAVALKKDDEQALFLFLEGAFSVEKRCISTSIDSSDSSVEANYDVACSAKGSIKFGSDEDPLSETVPLWISNGLKTKYDYARQGLERDYFTDRTINLLASSSTGTVEDRDDLLFLDASIRGVHISNDGSGVVFMESIHEGQGKVCLRVR